MKTHVEFRSDLFPQCEGDKASLNPERFGKRLADFLVAGLRAKGFEPDQPSAEDWGWMVPIKNDKLALWIGCGQCDEHLDGCLCFIEPHEPLIRRLFRRIDTTGPVLALQEALNGILSANPGITEIKWWTYEEFMRPKSD